MAQGMFEEYIEEIAQRVEALHKEGVYPVVIGIDGVAASGKTALANILAQRLDASIVTMDDFFLPSAFRTIPRLWEPGGNVYHERFSREVLPYLRSGELFAYRLYNGRLCEYVGTRDVWPKPVMIVEGTYCMHPVFGDIYDLRLFLETCPYEQEKRLREARPTEVDLYKAMWIPMEERYHKAFHIKENCHMVITSGGPQPEDPLEIERKWLIRMPDLEFVLSQSSRFIYMEQAYLRGCKPGFSMRIRRSEEKGRITLHLNEKRRISDTVRIERESVIDYQHFLVLQGFCDPALRKIDKKRYCVPIEGGLIAEIDVFPFWKDRAFCEVELPTEDTPVILPDWMDVVREVTDDPRYTNLALAREIPMEDI